jgi:exodeoxyribonuclease-1
VLTFAGVRTDSRLREIDRTSLAIRLRHDIIPSPEAFVTHCLTPEELESGLSEYEAARTLHDLFNTPDTISLGYNSLGFDDEFLRFLFYRNLLEPYTHQYADGCFRADLLPVAALFSRFCDSPVIRWPCLENGKPTLKLEHIASANRFELSGPAHDAMADVQALVALCRRFSGRADIWAYAMGFFDRHTDLKRVDTLPESCRIRDRFFRKALMVSPSFGPDAGYLAPVLHIGRAVPYANQQLWIRLDRPECGSIDPETRRFDWFPIRKKPADQWLVLPPLDRFIGKLSDTARQTSANVLARFRENFPVFMDTVQTHLAYAYPVIPDLDPDAALYQDGFFTAAEKQDIARFHAAGSFDGVDPEALSQVLTSVRSPRIRTLAARILSRNFHMPPAPEFQTHLKKLVHGGKITGFRNNEKRTLPQAAARVKDIALDETALDSRQRHALNRVDACLQDWMV